MEHFRILLAEDNPLDVRLLQALLAEVQGISFEFHVAGTLAKMLTLAQSCKADVLLLDLSLPDSTGLETVSTACTNLPHMPVVVLTGATDHRLGLQAVKYGAQDYLLKGQIECAMFVQCLRYAIERKQAQEQLRFHASLFNQIRNGVVATDPQGTIIYWNQYAQTLYHWPSDEVIGRPFTDIARPLVEESPSSIFQRVLEGGHWAGEWTVQSKEDGAFPAHITVACTHDLNGDLQGFVIVLVDITERKQMEAELAEYRCSLEKLVEERTVDLMNVNQTLQTEIQERERIQKELIDLNRLKTEFLSTAAHELRTPLTSIRGFSELILVRELPSERQKKYMTFINEQSTLLGHIIDDILDLSRLEANRKLTLSLQPIDMKDLLVEVVAPFREAASCHRIEFVGFDPCPNILGDPMRLAQVAKNLISNAIKYSPQGGTITIYGEVIAQNLQISIRDEGIGMTSEQQAHLFEKFYRGDASNTAIGGTGLGLAISKSIIELHNGSIWAVSEYGQGSTFYLTLPVGQIPELSYQQQD